MMYLMEPFFDAAYLGVVLGMGIRLLLEEEKDARIFGLMAVLLGLGDTFHLIPRVMSNLTPDGFSRYIPLLSWGEFVTSITMTIFYLLFYRYYQSMSGDTDNRKSWLVYVLVALRLLLVLLPQNEWGTEGNYFFGLLRNVPFALLGLVLVIWTVVAFMVRGIYTITAEGVALFPDAMLSGMAGIGHIFLGIGVVWTMLHMLKEKKQLLPQEESI